MISEPKFKMGQKFKLIGKHQKILTIVDIYKTFNSKGELVKVNYISECDYLGQKIKYYDICDATVARGLIND